MSWSVAPHVKEVATTEISVGVHDLKQALMGEHAGVTGLIMQCEPGGTGREIYTATVDGNDVPVLVDPNLKPDQIIAAILIGVKQQESTNDISDS
ncbi:hypothetical protein [Tardiphaga sp. 1201_B9_N1_2]|uniref:hypothetical protein n=1 Tax=Tardiphaga sp. 1201_B9_N1_2 TaxID=3240378 RepID=UPI003F1E85F5